MFATNPARGQIRKFQVTVAHMRGIRASGSRDHWPPPCRLVSGLSAPCRTRSSASRVVPGADDLHRRLLQGPLSRSVRHRTDDAATAVGGNCGRRCSGPELPSLSRRLIGLWHPGGMAHEAHARVRRGAPCGGGRPVAGGRLACRTTIGRPQSHEERHTQPRSRRQARWGVVWRPPARYDCTHHERPFANRQPRSDP